MSFGKFVATVFAVAFGIITAGIISLILWLMFFVAVAA